MLAAMIGFVGVLVSALLMWIRSDIKSIRTETNSRFDAMDRRFDTVDRRFDTVNTILAEHGQRLARIETVLSVPVSPPEQASTEPAVAG